MATIKQAKAALASPKAPTKAPTKTPKGKAAAKTVPKVKTRDGAAKGGTAARKSK